LLSLLAIVETYAIIDKIEDAKSALPAQTDLVEQITKNTTPIKDISGKSKSKKGQVEEFA